MILRLCLAAFLAWAAPARADEIAVTQYGTSFAGLPFTIALAHGLFAQSGIEITGFITSGGGGTTVRNMLASPTQYGEVYIGAALAAAAQGLDIVIVNIGTRTVSDFAVVTMPNSPVKTLHDLAGAKVAITAPRAMSEVLLLLELQAKGIDAAKVQRVAAGGYVNGLVLLEQGAVAAATLAEPLSIVRAGQYRTVGAARDILAPMAISVGITTRAFATAHPEKLRAIIAARRAAVEALYANPAASAAIAAKAYDLDPAIAAKSIDTMAGLRLWSLGDFDRVELDRAVDALRTTGALSEAPDVAKLIDPTFLPPDLQQRPPVF